MTGGCVCNFNQMLGATKMLWRLGFISNGSQHVKTACCWWWTSIGDKQLFRWRTYCTILEQAFLMFLVSNIMYIMFLCAVTWCFFSLLSFMSVAGCTSLVQPLDVWTGGLKWPSCFWFWTNKFFAFFIFFHLFYFCFLFLCFQFQNWNLKWFWFLKIELNWFFIFVILFLISVFSFLILD